MLRPLTERDLEAFEQGCKIGRKPENCNTYIEHGFLDGIWITNAGRDALAAFRTLKRGEMLKPAGNRSKFGHSVPTSSYQPLTDEDRKSLRLKCHLEVPT